MQLSITCKKSAFSSRSKLSLALTLLMAGVSQSAVGAPVIDYGENMSALAQGFNQGKVHILQIGDSHTAGDYFTEQLRKNLQRELGDGGIGFAPPYKVSGQRVARHGYAGYGWTNLSSKFDSGNFPLGGFTSETYEPNNSLVLTSEYYAGQRMTANVVVSAKNGSLTFSDAQGTRTKRISGNRWQVVPVPIQFPVNIQAQGDVQVGGFWLTRPRGGIVSAMGINGSQIKQWNRWRSNITQDIQTSQAQLVILAYGTNEAFSDDVSDFNYALTSAVRKVRQALPNASVLIVGAPESLKNKYGRCGTRPNFLNQVQNTAQQVAQKEQTLFWSWQEAMGGYCSMKGWIRDGLAGSDAVHFTRYGYETAADDLYGSLITTLNQYNANNNTTANINTKLNQSQPSTYTPPKGLTPSQFSKGKLCAADGTNCKYIR